MQLLSACTSCYLLQIPMTLAKQQSLLQHGVIAPVMRSRRPRLSAFSSCWPLALLIKAK